MDRLVRVMSARSRIDFVAKLVALLLVMGAMNWVRDMLEHGAGADTYLSNFREAAFVGLLPTILALKLVSHLDRLQQRLGIAALCDPLTGLTNRRGFFEAVEAALPEPGGVLIMLDADHFKQINDDHGHGAGDACLIRIAGLLRAEAGPGDSVGRLGGEEFALFLAGAGIQQARAIGDRLTEGVTLDLPGSDGCAAPRVTLSAGAVSTRGAVDLAQLLSQADAALYAAKAAGRARLVVAPAAPAGTEPAVPPVRRAS